MGGVAVVFWTAILLVFLVLLSFKQGFSYGKLSVILMVLGWMGWGIRQIFLARRSQKELQGRDEQEHERDA